MPTLPGISDEVKRQVADGIAERMIPALEQAATALQPEETVPLALDWMNGRRTPDANQRLTGAITGIRLGTDAPRIFRSLVEATAFGSRAIVERFRAQGIRIDSAIAIGGVAKKSRFVMQTIADVMNLEVTVAAGDQTVALGAAMFAATAAGLYPQVEDAQRAMSSGTESVYQPDPGRAKRYDRLYKDYLALGAFVESELRRASLNADRGNKQTMSARSTQEVWFLTGSQELYGQETLNTVAEHSRQIAAHFDETLPVRVVWKPTLTGPEAITQICLEANAAPACVGVITWMHTFSPAKMWVDGLNQLGKPLAHLHTQFNRELPWSEIDMGFMNLNQSAHGDREYGFILARLRLDRKIVVGHWQDSEVIAELDGWSRVALRGRRVAQAEDRPLRRHEHARGRGDGRRPRWRRRSSSAGRRTATASAIWSARIAEVGDAEVDHLVEEYEAKYTLVPELRRGGDRRESLRYAARQEIGIRAFLTDGGYGAFTTTFEDLHGLEAAARARLPAADGDGYGFGAEGDWKAAGLVRLDEGHAAGAQGRRVVHGGLHVSPGQGPGDDPRRAHARGLPLDRRRRRREAFAGDSPARHRRQGATRAGWCSTRRRDRRSPRRSSTWAGGMRHGRAGDGRRESRARDAEASDGARGLRCRGRISGAAREAWLLAGGAHHTVVLPGGHGRQCRIWPACWASSACASATTPSCARSRTSCAGTTPRIKLGR